MKRHFHKLNSTHDTTMEIGTLVPVQFLDVIAGQTTFLNTSALLRFQPLISPAFEQMNMHIVHFFVPYRLLWDKWFEFVSGLEQLEIPTAKVDFNVTRGWSYETLAPFNQGLFEYIDLFPDFRSTSGVGGSIQMKRHFCYFPFLAYYKIWNEHFRDTEIQEEVDLEALKTAWEQTFEVNSTNSNMVEDIKTWANRFALKRVNWGSDRFTTALLQDEANPSISLPVGSDGTTWKLTDNKKSVMGAYFHNFNGQGDIAYSSSPSVGGNNGGFPVNEAPLYYAGGLTGVDLEDFQLAVQLRNFKLNQNRFGKDIKGYFAKYGLKNMDLRLDRSEVIGGFSQTIQISDIIATSSENLGKQGGHALGLAKPRRFKHYAPEHGLIMTLAYIRPKVKYYGGVDRFFHKRDMLDFFQKEFENVGYQPIYKTEITDGYLQGSLPESEDDMQVFGYEHRYNEYRTIPSVVSGNLRPGATMSSWANPRTFSALPNLNNEFLECKPSNSIWAFPNEPKAICHFKRNVSVKSFVGKGREPYIKL